MDPSEAVNEKKLSGGEEEGDEEEIQAEGIISPGELEPDFENDYPQEDFETENFLPPQPKTRSMGSDDNDQEDNHDAWTEAVDNYEPENYDYYNYDGGESPGEYDANNYRYSEIPGEFDESNYIHPDSWNYDYESVLEEHSYQNEMPFDSYYGHQAEFTEEEDSPRINDDYSEDVIGDVDKVGEEEQVGEDAKEEEEEDSAEEGKGDGYCDSESDKSNWNLSLYNEMIAREQEQVCKKPYHGAEDFIINKRVMKKFFISNPGNNDSELHLPGNILCQHIGRRINNEDLVPIREAIPECRNVSYINLAYNEIDDKGADYLGTILVDYGNIGRLNLAHNNLTSHGLLRLVTLLIRRSPLFELKLTGMKIGDDVGVNALVSLILAGRCPVDLDISECDLNLEAYQKLCTAWHAMDHDIDYPESLLNLDLPFTLGDLQFAKEGYNKEKEDDIVLNQRKLSFQPAAPARANIFQHSDSDNFVEELYMDMLKDHDDIPNNDLLRKFSTSMLEGLFEMATTRQEVIEMTQKEIDDYGGSKEVAAVANKMMDVEEIIEEYHNIQKKRDRNEEVADEDGRPIIVTPSLYSLELHEDPEMDFVHPDHQHQVKHANPLYIDNLLARSGKEALHDDEEEIFGAVDVNVAQLASVKFMANTFIDVASVSTRVEIPTTSDINQIMLMEILDTVERISKARGEGNVFNEEMICSIIEEGVEKVEKILFPTIPSDCSVGISDLRMFLKQLFLNTQSTFTALMESPFVGETMREVGSVACRESKRAREVIEHKEDVNHPSYNVKEERLRLICINFLDGAIKEAARIIGVGDPYGFQVKHVTEDTIQPFIDLKEDIETEVLPTLNNIFAESARMAAAAEEKIAWMHREEAIFNQAGRIVVADVFQDVTDAIAGIPLMKDRSREYSDPLAPKKYQYISRPTRLILNRPLFAGNEEIIGAKMADYLKTNSSVKILHMRKWGLGEDGTQALMEGLMMNCNIVTLDLASNSIGPEGARPIAEYIKKSPNLRHLLLNHNQIKNPGIKLMTEAISNATTCNLVTINIAYNDIDGDGLDPFLLAMRFVNVKAVYLIGNKFSEQTFHILGDLIYGGIISQNMTDVVLQESHEEFRVVRNGQMRDMNEWYGVPPMMGKELNLPPYYDEKVERLQNPFPIPDDSGDRFDDVNAVC